MSLHLVLVSQQNIFNRTSFTWVESIFLILGENFPNFVLSMENSSIIEISTRFKLLGIWIFNDFSFNENWIVNYFYLKKIMRYSETIKSCKIFFRFAHFIFSSWPFWGKYFHYENIHELWTFGNMNFQCFFYLTRIELYYFYFEKKEKK